LETVTPEQVFEQVQRLEQRMLERIHNTSEVAPEPGECSEEMHRMYRENPEWGSIRMPGVCPSCGEVLAEVASIDLVKYLRSHSIACETGAICEYLAELVRQQVIGFEDILHAWAEAALSTKNLHRTLKLLGTSPQEVYTDEQVKRAIDKAHGGGQLFY